MPAAPPSRNSDGGFDGSYGAADSDTGVSPAPAPPRAPRPQPVAIGARLGGYQLVGLLGRGGMGAVYRARDPRTRREVALKLLHGAEAKRKQIARFQREGILAAGLDHPGIVKVLSAGEEDGRPFLVYELVEGAESLKAVLSRAGRTRRIELIRDVARALGHAHARGIVHRDVKPENVLIDPAGRVRVTDLGLASGGDCQRLTKTGAMIGTPYYMPPEQLRTGREGVGPPADVWSLGVILYLALTDTLPFPARDLFALTVQIDLAKVRPPRSHDRSIPPELEAVCLRALQREPAARYPHGDAFAGALDAWLEGPRSSGPRPVRSLALGASALLVLGGAWLAWGQLGTAGPARSDAAPRAPAVPAAPLSLDLRPVADATWERSTRVAGVVHGGHPGWTLRVGALEQAVRAGVAFELEVPLVAGHNALTVEVRDGSGRRAAHELIVERHAGPDWLDAWEPAARPPLPLPPGLAFGESPREFVNERDGSVLVWVPPGGFEMGSHAGPPQERPVHAVRFTRGYFIGKYEVTVEQYRRFCDLTARELVYHHESASTPRHPAHFVAWQDAQDYCAWAGLQLPTEAQWEYAARGPARRVFPWSDGSPDRAEVARSCNTLDGADGFRTSSPVGSFPAGASPFGCLDMAGNVYEWTRDGAAGYLPEAVDDPWLDPAPAPARVIRGGAFATRISAARTTAREYAAPDTWTPFIGFRVGLSLVQEKPVQ